MTNHFFPDNAPLPLEIHGLDQARAIVRGTVGDEELLVSFDEDRVWIRAQDKRGSTHFFIAPQKAAAIGNAFLRFAELAAERAKEKNNA